MGRLGRLHGGQGASARCRSTPGFHRGQGRITRFDGLSPTTTPWGAPEAGGAPRPTSAWTVGDDHSRFGSPRVRPVTTHSLPLIDDIRVPAAGTGGTAATPPGLRYRRQGLLPPLDPKSPTPQGNPCRHPREERPDRPPHQQGQSRRAATVLRRRAVPGTATSSSERSTGSRAGEESPPATTNTPATHRAAWSSPASSCSGRPQHPIRQTGLGELRMQRQDAAGQWLCQVQYRRPGELSSHIDTFPASQVRADTLARASPREDGGRSPP